MTYPLVTDLAADGVPVAVTCRVLKNSRARLLPVEDEPGDGAGLGGCAPGQHRTGHPRLRYCIRIRFIADELPEKGSSRFVGKCIAEMSVMPPSGRHFSRE
jgi:hypothetical protein